MQELAAEGFQRAGTYARGRFNLDLEWAPRQVVYAWMRSGRVVRVGIACGITGMRARYNSYNRWLAGLHKPSDEREQRASAYVREGLGDYAEVWARQVGGKKEALALEKSLRLRWAASLDLDGMVRGGRFRTVMAARRAEGAKHSTASFTLPERTSRRAATILDRSDIETKLTRVEDWVKQAFEALDKACSQAGLTARKESGPGLRWVRPDGRTMFRLHPKLTHLCVGLPNSRRGEVAATGKLRAQADGAWFDVNSPDELPLARDLIGLL